MDCNMTIHVLAATHVSGGPTVKDAGLGIVDTACVISVMGSQWWQNYREKLAELALLDHVTEMDAVETFRFGDGSRQVSFARSCCCS